MRVSELDLIVSLGVQLNIATTFLRLSQCTKKREDVRYVGCDFRDPTSVGIFEVPAVHIAVTRCI